MISTIRSARVSCRCIRGVLVGIVGVTLEGFMSHRRMSKAYELARGVFKWLFYDLLMFFIYKLRGWGVGYTPKKKGGIEYIGAHPYHPIKNPRSKTSCNKQYKKKTPPRVYFKILQKIYKNKKSPKIKNHTHIYFVTNITI